MTSNANITADAVALQERDEFRENGWIKALAPAKVNLHLAIGKRRSDGYHDAATVMHALNLHDVVYLRSTGSLQKERGADSADTIVACRMVAGDSTLELPDVAPGDNLAARAVTQLARATGHDAGEIELRIEKNIPSQAGLGGGSSDAAAALAAAARLWQLDPDDPRIEQTARSLGADVAFFLHGACAYLEGTGDEFVRALAPSKQAVVLVKPPGGVSTAAAYRTFDEQPVYPTPEQASRIAAAQAAVDVPLFNNLAPASEALMPELAEVCTWLEAQPQTQAALLCGSGAATFALCATFADATAVATEARKRNWWSRVTSLGSLRALAAPAAPAAPIAQERA